MKRPTRSGKPARTVGATSSNRRLKPRRQAKAGVDGEVALETLPMMTELYRRAAVEMGKQPKQPRTMPGASNPEADSHKLIHELQVHQVELELQNTDLKEMRDRMEALLEKYSDLYDFAPVGYCTIDESGVILEANLTGAALLGVERGRLINRRMLVFVSPASRQDFLAFLKEAFTGIGGGGRVSEVRLTREGGATFWAGFQAGPAISIPGAGKCCRVAFEDITSRKLAEEARSSAEAMAVKNRTLRRELVRRRAMEKALKKSERHKSRLLDLSQAMQEQMRHLSRQLLRAQEEERKRISRELHDVIAQTLSGINLRLTELKREATVGPRVFGRSITRTQKLVEQSVNLVHRFALDLRPRVLDDLGLIPALHALMKCFKRETGIHASLSAFAAVDRVNGDKRIVLYRVAQEALNNVARHAQASRAEVRVQKLDSAICIRIRDNGRGFRTGGLLHVKRSNRLGLLGMSERVEMVGGEFTIKSAPGKGTTVIARIPIANEAHEERRNRPNEK
jgi:PAS domain S-box-containing protein